MKTAALLLKLLFIVLTLTTLGLLVSEVVEALRPVPMPVAYYNSAAPSVYSYVQPISR